jgi:uncharacterized pyridoxamine 5'-phosphate oxidase family protein
MDEVYEFLKKVGTYYIATIDGDQPRVRAFGTIDLFEGKLHIQTGKVKDVSKQIAANPQVEICAFDGEQWLRVAATLAEDPRIEAQQHMLASYPELADMYQPGDGNNQVLYLSNVTARFTTFGGEPRTVTF